MSTIKIEETELFKSLLPNPEYIASIKNCIDASKLFLQKYHLNFPDFTDHSIYHSFSVIKFASKLLSKEDLENLTPEEKYILIMSCIVHDIGMSIPSDSLFNFISKDLFDEFIAEREEKDEKKILMNFIRNFHHLISYEFIIQEYEKLHIINKKFAEAIAIVAKNHREVQILAPLTESIFHIRKNGIGLKVCLPYLSCILLIADELDIPKTKIPELIKLYYWPKSPVSVKEYQKHLGILQVNFSSPYIEIEGYCDNPKIYYEIISLLEKIENKIRDCNKIIRFLPKIREKKYKLSFSGITALINPKGFLPKKIKFSIDADPIFKRFMENNLYDDPFIAIREALQNSIDTCRYKKYLNQDYQPLIKITLEPDLIEIEDNGLGMDEFIIENFFSRLGGSFYYFKRENIPKNITAQFGIGVFAYFLLCNSFEVNTKMLGKSSLHFVIHKETDSYFYFYKNIEYNKEGTKIISYLKPSIKLTIDFESIINKLKKYFHYVEIPIYLKYLSNEEIISNNKIDFSSKEIYENSINFQELEDKFNENEIVSLSERTEDFEIGLGYHPLVEFSRTLDPFKIFEGAKYKSINIYYKGVFLNKMESILMKNFNLIGAINILKDEALQLNRSNFVHKNFLRNMLKTYEFQFLKKIMEKISKNLDEVQAKKLINSIRYDFIPINELNIFKDLSFMRVRVKKSVFKNFSFNGLQKDFERFLYLPGVIGDVKFSKTLFEKYNLPVLMPESSFLMNRNLLFDLLITSSKLSLESYNNRQYFTVDRGNVEEVKIYKLEEKTKGKTYYYLPKIYFTQINSESIINYFDVETGRNILIFNTNNLVSKFIYKKMDFIIDDLHLKEVFMEIIDKIGNIKFYDYFKEEFRTNLKEFYNLLNLCELISLDTLIKEFEN